MVLPVDEPPDKRYKLIAHELSHIFQYSMFFEGYLGRALRANPPTWLIEGMASYLADDEDNLDRMVIRDAVVNNIVPPIQALDVLAFITYRYGHAVFDFIEQEHGKEGLRTFLFEFKKVLLTGNLAKAIKESFGYDIDEFNRRFNRYLRRKYFPVLLEKKSPDEYGKEIGLKRGNVTFSPTLSPSGELVAALSAPKMELDLLVLSAEDGSKVKNLTAGWTNKYGSLATEAPQGRRDISWSPTADRIALFARRENKWPLLVIDALNGKIVHDIELDNLFECAGPAYAPDGRRIAFECNRDGVVDIFEYNLDTKELKNLTQDDFFDANPWYSADGTSLLYNRRIGEYWKVFSVDLTDPAKKTQLTFGPSSDIQPSYSRDGKRVYYSSDRGPYGVFNIYALDLATGDVAQYTDVVGGCFAPVEASERDGETTLVYGAFFEGTYRLFRMPLHAPELRISAEDRLAEPQEAEPFEPDVRLTVDEDKKHPYKPRWDLESPSVSVGLADDGTFLSDVGLQFSDLLGDQRIFINASSVADFASYNVSYFNLKRRFNWGATIYDVRDYYVNAANGRRIRQAYRQTGLGTVLQYPISRTYRLESSAELIDWSQAQPFASVDPANGLPVVDFIRQSGRFGIVSGSVVGDTTRYQGFGPFQGRRFNFTARYGQNLSGDLDGNLVEAAFDVRTYKQLTRRSLLAWRLFTVQNFGDFEPTYGYGGLNELRGFGFRSLFGSKLAGSNLEFRFPLVDELRFPFLPIRNIRGFVFLDVGAAWFDKAWYDPELKIAVVDPATGAEQLFTYPGFRIDPTTGENVGFKFWDSQNNRLQDGRASYGVGFQFQFIGGLQLNWSWARRLAYTQYVLYPDEGRVFKTRKADVGSSRFDFYITYDF